MGARNAATPEAQIRELLDAWTKAVRARDLKAVLARHSPDIVMFDVPPPEQWRGLRKYRESWELFFRHFPREGGVFEITGMDIGADGDLAYGYGLLRCGRQGDTFPVRLTGVPAPDRWRMDDRTRAPFRAGGRTLIRA